MVLNPALFDRLRSEFGKVLIAKEGEPLSGRYLASPTREGVVDLVIANRGETYRVDCPYCGDRRARLWINHRFGSYDSVCRSKNIWLAKCFNDDCVSDFSRANDLYTRIYGFRNSKLRDSGLPPTRIATETACRLHAVNPPGTLIKLPDLPDSHPAIRYLRDRRFDPGELSDIYNISICVEAAPEHPLAENRLVIPIYMRGILVGWQCRYISDLNWKEARVPKYYSCRNMPKRLMLYNFDNAAKRDYVIICEGPTDVWRAGPHAVALMGKSLSDPQLQTICTTWAGGAVIVLLDGDAVTDACGITRKLVDHFDGKVAFVPMPGVTDPGDMLREQLDMLIHESALAQDLDLKSFKRKQIHPYDDSAST